MAIIYRGFVSGAYQYWNEFESIPNGVTNVTIASFGSDYWQTDIDGNIAASGSVNVGGALSVGSSGGAGRGLLKVGTIDISPITGSAQTDSISTSAIMNGDLLSASYGVWDGTNSVALRHEIHVLAIGQDLNSNINQYAATFLVMTHINVAGYQTGIDIVEISKECTGSYAVNWDVNITNECDITVNGNTNSGSVYWYAQRTKEMAIRSDGSRI